MITRYSIPMCIGLAALLLASCLRSPSFQCDQHGADSCGVGATCEPSGFCSRTDSSCAMTGRRYVDSAGQLAGQCVDVSNPSPDAGVDANPPRQTSTCVVGPAQPNSDDCAARVCERAPGCCSSMWTGDCVRLSATMCGRACSNAVSTGSLNSVGVGVSQPSWHAVFTLQTGDWTSIAWADFDGDGDADLAYSELCDVHIMRNLNTSDGLLEMERIGGFSIPGCTEERFVWGDYDGDGDLDLLHGSDKGLVLASNTGDGSFAAPVELLDSSHSILDIDVADFNQDGFADMVVSVRDGPAQLYRHDQGTQKLVSGWTGPGGARRVVWCDVDDNPATGPSIAAIGTFNVLSLYRNVGGSPSAAAEFAIDTPGVLLDIACGDLDGDGTAEIVTLASEAKGGLGHVRVHSIDGAVVWTSPTAYISKSIDIGDISGDGRLDIVVDANPPGSDVTIPEPFHVFRQLDEPSLSFVDELGGDWAAFSDVAALEIVHLDL